MNSYDSLMQQHHQRGDVRVVPLLGSNLAENPVPQWQEQYASPCIVLRSANGRDHLVLDSVALSMGVLNVGGIGMGKTNVIKEMLRQLLRQKEYNDTLVIFDAKGDYASAFYDSRDPSHVLIGSREFYPTAVRWNIFSEIGALETLGSPATQVEEEMRTLTIAKALFYGRESASQPFFHQAAVDLLQKSILHLIRLSRKTGNRKLLCNRELVNFLRETDVSGWRRMLTEDNPDFRASAHYFGGTKGDMGASVLATLSSMVNDLFSGDYGRGETQDVFSMRDAVQHGGKVVFVEYDLSVGETLCPIYRLLLDRAIKTRTSRACRTAGNLFVVADELKLLPRVDLSDAINLARDLGAGRGVRVIAACQNVNQIFQSFGKEEGLSMLGGFGTCIAFNNPDAETRQYLSSRFGRTYEAVVYEAIRNPIPVTREGYVLEDHQILDLARGEAAVKIPFRPPFMFSFDQYIR